MQTTRIIILVVSLALIGLTGCNGTAGTTGAEIKPTKAISQLTLDAKAKAPEGKHFVTNWLMLGPFQFKEADFKGEHQQASADHAFMAKEGCLNGTQKPPKGASWKEKNFDSFDGKLGLEAFYGGIDYAAAYAVCWLQCDKDIADAQILVGSDDYITVWVNGKKLHCYKEERRAGEADQDTIKGVTLKRVSTAWWSSA